ncbi:anti-sigma factor [Oerskovia flava]|uniref:anti-sigma factor n=1 Tax=Oerskovia flava TaxID=2986422 RepID=UPI00223EAE79|nr:anti-sigma factor [Oerskovia sp. JB1-3-2]
MQHVDPEILALLALGEEPAEVASDAELAHASTCPQCAGEVAELGHVARTGRESGHAEPLVAPVPAVWERVHAELGLSDAVARLDEVEPTAPLPAGPAEPAEPEVQGGTVHSLADRRRARAVPVAWTAAAASAALVVGVTGGVLWESRETAPSVTTLATAALDALPDWPDAAGDARVEETADGTRQVVVSVDAPTAPDGAVDGYREVWLIADDLSGLVSLGVLEGTEGRFDVPTGLDLDRYSLVDVSHEHFDGDPTHSGDSIVRGGLQT